jgi:hypothetical protein
MNTDIPYIYGLYTDLKEINYLFIVFRWWRDGGGVFEL